ncbi:hypothetical protein CBS101457_003494 [Exobasidium rhododendri]|nr:hypothetical protein CBS101457_003494 [Exobasidium rhododendri]
MYKRLLSCDQVDRNSGTTLILDAISPSNRRAWETALMNTSSRKSNYDWLPSALVQPTRIEIPLAREAPEALKVQSKAGFSLPRLSRQEDGEEDVGEAL